MLVFQRRFLAVIILLPFAASLLLAAPLLSQLLQFERAEWLRLGVAWVVCYGLASALLSLRLGRVLRTVQQARTTEALSAALSESLGAASNGSNVAWLGGGIAFTVAGTLLAGRSVHVFTSLAVTALLTGVLAIIFVYAAAKRMIAHEAERSSGVVYTGPEIGVARKIGVIFIGVFVASIAALVALVSARVSLNLERLAISGAERDFTGSIDIARASDTLTDEELQRLDMYLASKYIFFRVGREGRVVSSQPRSAETLTPDEVRRVRSLRNGDSASFVAPHVMRFSELRDGSILVMRIPWDHFQAVPRQILFYALLVAAFTLLIFAAATYFLAADLTMPLRRVRQLSIDLADGNFATVATIFTDDEISSVAKGAMATRANLRALLGEVGGSGATISRRVRSMSDGSDSLVIAAREQSTLSTTSSAALANVRRNAESVRNAAATVADRAMQASNGAAQLAVTADRIARGTDALFASIDQISGTSAGIGRAAEEMSQRTGSIAAASDDIVSSVVELDATVEELRRTAAATAELSRQVDANAASGVTAVARTVQGIETARHTTATAADVMRQLGKSTTEIARILSIIEDVASRTNLLSLNAAIIAAQAGSQGAGFQVVAEEIRMLADQTRQSTKEITAIVHAIGKDSRGAIEAIEKGVSTVEESVKLAREASASLSTIQESAAASMGMSQQTTRSLDEQARAAVHLRQVVTRFAGHVQEIDRGARDHARASTSLSSETERVRTVVNGVNRATQEQSDSASAITNAMAAVADDIAGIRDELAAQLAETQRIAGASDQILEIARDNDRIASDFGVSVGDLLATADDFERAVGRFRM